MVAVNTRVTMTTAMAATLITTKTTIAAMGKAVITKIVGTSGAATITEGVVITVVIEGITEYCV